MPGRQFPEKVLDGQQARQVSTTGLPQAARGLPERLVAFFTPHFQQPDMSRRQHPTLCQRTFDDAAEPALVQGQLLDLGLIGGRGRKRAVPDVVPEAAQLSRLLRLDHGYAATFSFSTMASATSLVPTEVGSSRSTFMS